MITEMPKLMLIPLIDGYNVNLARNVITTDTESGFPRTRKDSIGKPHLVSATYKCSASQLEYFIAFNNRYEGLPFLTKLKVDRPGLNWYECNILNDYIPYNELGNGFTTMQLSLVVKPSIRNVESDIEITDVYNMTDSEIDEYFKLLEKMVNEDLPASLERL